MNPQKPTVAHFILPPFCRGISSNFLLKTSSPSSVSFLTRMCWNRRNWGQGDQVTTLVYSGILQTKSQLILCTGHFWSGLPSLLHSVLSGALTHPSSPLNVTCGHEVSQGLLYYWAAKLTESSFNPKIFRAWLTTHLKDLSEASAQTV